MNDTEPDAHKDYPCILTHSLCRLLVFFCSLLTPKGHWIYKSTANYLSIPEEYQFTKPSIDPGDL